MTDKIETKTDAELEILPKKYVKIKVTSLIILCLLGLLFVLDSELFFSLLMFFYIFG